MNEIVSYDGTYEQYKTMMECELREAAEGFVRIGYLLKIARDTDVLKNSGYKDVNEFAKAEYGLTRDVVSRYIEINTRYSEGGCSDRLQERYKAFGYSKLAEMLTLPETVAEELTPETTREEIREIKREIREEQEISDIEVMLESEPEKPSVMPELETIPEKVFYEVMKHFDTYHKVKSFFWNDSDPDAVESKWILNTFAPAGRATLTVRVPKTGKFMITFDESKEDVAIINVRSMEKEHVDLGRVGSIIERLTEYDYYDVYPDEKQEAAVENAESRINSRAETDFGTESAKTEEKTAESRINSRTDTDFEPGKTEVAPAQPEYKDSVSKGTEYKEDVNNKKQDVNNKKQDVNNKKQDVPDINIGNKYKEAAGQRETAEAVPGVEVEITDAEKAVETAEKEILKAEIETVPEYCKEEPDEEAGDETERKEPDWYGLRWSEMLDAFEELNGFFRTYRKRDMESQVIPKAKLRMIHDHAVNMAAAIEKSIGAGYGK